jgi:DNA-binding transcriptional ArsR family regulator
MVTNRARSAEALDATFHALAHPTRRAMLQVLADGEEHTVGELAAPFDVSLAASSKHLIVLEKANLVRRRVVGRETACRLASEPLKLISDWTDAFRETWETNFAQLDAVLDEMKKPSPRRTPRKNR